MPKCPICGGPLDYIETDDGRVPDDCPHCVPRGYDCCDPTSPSPDPVVVRLEAEVERLRNNLAEVQKELGMVRLAWDSDIKIAVEARTDDARLRALLREACECDPDVYWLTKDWHSRATIERERDEARGAMRADDERLRLAAARVGIVAGCDATDEMADEIERLRALLQEAVAIWDAEPSYECVLPWRWFDEVKAALEGKP